MSFRRGRRPHERLIAMRFALWAAAVPPHLLTPRQVSGLLDISPTAAKRWLHDYNQAVSPIALDHVPDFLIPHPEAPFTVSAATARVTTRS